MFPDQIINFFATILRDAGKRGSKKNTYNSHHGIYGFTTSVEKINYLRRISTDNTIPG